MLIHELVKSGQLKCQKCGEVYEIAGLGKDEFGDYFALKCGCGLSKNDRGTDNDGKKDVR